MKLLKSNNKHLNIQATLNFFNVPIERLGSY